MGRSRKKKSYRQDRRVESFPRSLPALRPDKNLRALALAARLDLERRQFEPSVKEFPDEFRAKIDEKFVGDQTGTPVYFRQVLSDKLPIQRNSNLQKGTLPSLHYYVFDNRRYVPLCARRSARRAVLFALRRTGKGSKRGKKHIWKAESKIRCI